MEAKLFNRITILFGLLLLIIPLVQGQEVDKSFNKTPQEMHDIFMKKSSNNSLSGVLTIVGGVVLAGVGVGLGEKVEEQHQFFFGGSYTTTHTYYSTASKVLMISGGIITTASIPFFISAGSNKRKAKLALKRESTVVGFKNNTQHISLSFTIPF